MAPRSDPLTILPPPSRFMKSLTLRNFLRSGSGSGSEDESNGAGAAAENVVVSAEAASGDNTAQDLDDEAMLQSQGGTWYPASSFD